MTENFSQEWVGIDEAVLISGHSRLSLFIKRKIGLIHCCQVGRSTMYNREEMERLGEEWLQSNNEGEF